MSRRSDRSRPSELRVEEERRRWARELHDETLQNLATLRWILSSARRAGGSEALGEAVDEAIAQLEEEIVNVRSMIADVRPAALRRLGIEDAIAALARRATRRGLAIAVRLDPTFRRASAADRGELNTAIYRIVQEALANALQHSRAERAIVSVREANGTIQLSIRDDGDGFHPDPMAGGLGLLGMRERVEHFGGTLKILSAPGRGSEIRATLKVTPSRSVIAVADASGSVGDSSHSLAPA